MVVGITVTQYDERFGNLGDNIIKVLGIKGVARWDVNITDCYSPVKGYHTASEL